MRIGHIELFCEDTEAAAEFYVGALGFQETVRQPGGFIWLQSGEIEVLLRPGKSNSKNSEYDQSGVSLVLYVESLENTLSQLAEKGITPVWEDSPGCPMFRDPAGHWVQVVENA